MSKKGEAWIESGQKRALERALVSPLVPAVHGLSRTNAVRHVDRALYPGDTFQAGKLGDPDRDSFLHRWLRRTMLDELPQALDIWRGSMTLIGPRADEPAHIEELFSVLDPDLRDRWQEVRFSQRPGVISSYAVHSHRHNLRGLAESTRFAEEEALALNAQQRAEMDIADFEAASLRHDLRLVAATAQMAVANYTHYATGLVAPQPAPSDT